MELGLKTVDNSTDLFKSLHSLNDAWSKSGPEVTLMSYVEKEITGELYQLDGADIYLVDQNYNIHLCLFDGDGTVEYDRDLEAKLIGDRLFLVNADNPEATDLVDVSKGFIGVSFACLKELGLDVNKITLTDYTNDHVSKNYNLSKKQLVAWELTGKDPAKFPYKAPGLGYTLGCAGSGRHYWHKAGHVLVSFEKKSYLLGFDDGQYFGVELPKYAKNIEEALRILTPKGAEGSDRQGEWFAVVCAKPKDCLILEDIECVSLPYEGNAHTINCSKLTIKDGIVYAFHGYMSHDQHPDISFDGKWVKFLKNTAVRSVSAEGVD